ncbi:MAG: adenosylcobinamide-GDP ribazoletransferase [Chlorobium sp.]|uniref:adenosylcobinamide-GDP ribazoletransferase n=1 Tax=Chlorobium sp. TaxID=1095 RepID=UPI0025BD3CCB|nr:adenosylcobinamide-GDP ribazoletransferase [Chlorobium sp.]MCF8215854.1 adenosylcobinamide-GDP ribazoletransferase [Chlorobium sp.]MCF8270752.1 adenosylcobinamide-GDP ribazoletransferase [Chlorobium sp.]MCF8287064.1 adenosylcobinamide-GDP ribazoletransferase [Chlorobium sp.]MCF8290721.1 adenosylcobinamide-GDP ribazoletransferase [Chlorobium sp.]MCF8384825.1 adenosylcobinamide-GDP ribazoletransferase [Chlorobium sp.]
MIRQTLSGIVTAVRTLTILPFPGKDAERFSTALYWFPFVGLLIGAFQAIVMYVGMLTGWVEFAGFATVLTGVIMTRGLHADGLADLADGFWGGKNRESVLRIMKDPNVGSFGVLALFFLMLLKWMVVTKLAAVQDYGSLVIGILLARWVQVQLASLMPYARREGGTAQSFVVGAGSFHMVVTTLCTVLLIFPLAHNDMTHVAVALISAAGAAAAAAVIAYRKIGGVTGDVLGASSELTECVVWLACLLSSAMLV